MKKKGLIRASKQDKIFYFVTTLLLLLFFLVVLYPIVFVISASFSSPRAVSSGWVTLLPVEPSVEGYQTLLRNKNIGRSYLNTILYTSLGTCINVSMAMLCAYPLARDTLPGRNFFTFMFAFTMYFSGGMVPSYILVRELGMIDKLWAMIIPGALSVYNMILARTFIQSSIPKELMEAARIDGCSDVKYFVMIVLPLSKAILAVLAIYSMVSHWNAYFNAMLYINSPEKMPLQIILKQILMASSMTADMIIDPETMEAQQNMADLLKYALIVVSTAPIMCIYPFVQKYFAKGVMIGSLKG